MSSKIFFFFSKQTILRHKKLVFVLFLKGKKTISFLFKVFMVLKFLIIFENNYTTQVLFCLPTDRL